MKKLLDKIKTWVAVIGSLLAALFGILWIFSKNKGNYTGTIVKDDCLKDNQDDVDGKIDDLNNDIDTTVPDDLTDKEIEDYWNN